MPETLIILKYIRKVKTKIKTKLTLLRSERRKQEYTISIPFSQSDLTKIIVRIT